MARTSLRTRLVSALTAAIAIALAAVGIALALDGDRDDRHPHLDTASGLLVSNRTALRICVEAAADDPALRQAVQERLLAALRQTRQDQNWPGAYGGVRYSPADVLHFGCPAPRLPLRFEPKTTLAGPGLTDNPSPFRVWVYVLDEPAADRILGSGQASAVATAELMAESRTAFPVSTALLIRHSRLADTTAAVQGLRQALGLEPRR